MTTRRRWVAGWLFAPLSCLAGQDLAPARPSLDAGVSARAFAASQAPEVALELADVIALALRDNRAIRSAYLERVAQKFDLRLARDRFAPQLTLKARYLGNRNHDDRYRHAELAPGASLLTAYGTRLSLAWAYDHTRADTAGPRFRDGADLMIRQPLLRGAGPEVATAPLRLAQLTEQTNRLALKDAVAQTITQVIGLYRELLRAQEQLRISRDALRRSQRLLEVNRSLIAAGRMAAFEIVQAEAQVANQELALEGSRDRLHASRLSLLQALALDLATPLRASERPQALRLQVSAEQAQARAEVLQPAYLMQLIASQQADIDLRLAHDQQRWDLSLVAGASQAHERPGDNRAWEHYLGLELEIPIGDLSRRQSLVRAQVMQATQQLRLAESRQQLRREVTDAVRDIEVRWRQYEIAGRALELSRRTLQIEQEKLALGRSSNFQVLSFESDLRHAQSAQLDALIAYLQAQAALDLTLGVTLERWAVALND
ncbi:TolC family protein [Pseudomonas entomophila]|uniref:TolC family protein n=1 Tax=Pseudomonas entomophila TaxID=312306 RepID=UPI0023D7BC78|nr:TolC family protein [Pseudomonas entomophila]MDF0730682.1 TolC family protein [Pseudomonas entomophila]